MQFKPINWINEIPYSVDFNDIYFSNENGILETEHVFIQQNQLQARFTNASNFTIIETGFGTGLNFYSAAARFLALAPQDATLNYISIEKFPIAPDDMQKIRVDFLKVMPEFTEISREFLTFYPKLKPGLNQFNLAESRVNIALYADDILNTLPNISQTADAWFLDGFAPAKNAEMWTDAVFAHMARLSKSSTTFSTFTSAGAVRRGLQHVGFEVQKCAGFGKKREMLRGVFV